MTHLPCFDEHLKPRYLYAGSCSEDVHGLG